MNLAELSKLDIKDLQKLDYKQLLQDSLKRPDLIVNVVAIIITIFICFNVYSKNKAELKTMGLDLSKLEQKTAVIDEYNALNTELKTFLENIPEKITKEKLYNMITDYAVARDIQIKSFYPAKSTGDDFHEVTTLRLNIEAKDYQQLWLFVHDIENAAAPLRIDHIRGNMDLSSRRRNKRLQNAAEEIKPFINIDIEITAVNYKNDT